MSAELQTIYTTGQTVYALIRDEAANIWDGSAFVAYNASDYSSYLVPLIEQSGSNGYYVGDFPTAIGAGNYGIAFYGEKSGHAPDPSDNNFAGGEYEWDGSGSGSSLLCSVGFAKDANAITIDTDDGIISGLLYSATKAIQNYCRRDFFLTSYVEAYDGPGNTVLILNQTPVASVSQVVLNVNDNDPETIVGSDYVINAGVGTIKLKSTSTATSYFVEGFQNVQASYVAGYSTIPQDVQEACAILTGAMYKARQTDRTIQSEKIGDYAVSYREAFRLMSDDVLQLLGPYRRFIC